jgi:hypothetical protein
MITKDLLSVKEKPRIRCLSFTVMELAAAELDRGPDE